MNHRQWRRFAMRHIGTLRIAGLLAIGATLVWSYPLQRNEWSSYPAPDIINATPRLAATPTNPINTIVGYAYVIDGDTLDISGTRIRLHGIDAPEAGQTCMVGARYYPCGQSSTVALAELVRGRLIRCVQVDVDRYHRIVARCRLEQSDISVNSWLVRQGYAVAYRGYSSEYAEDERLARSSHKGLWAGWFQMPWDYRTNVRAEGPRWP